jgi:parvulin-like peptidyl-prolyl cis-trans isomerase-like protein
MIQRLLREPLLHFAVLGGALFLAYATLAPVSAESSAIVVSSDQITSIAAQFRGTWQRPPSREELDALVEGYIRDEVLYREGLALGLERDDPVVRNRVKQKMEILSEDALSKEPTDAELQQYLDDHREAFETPAAITFEQVYFDLGGHGERIVADMHQALEALRAGRVASGDRTLLPLRMERVLPPDITAAFGPEFEKTVRELPVGVWSDALRSSFGAHLVRVTWRGTPIVPSLADARDTVLREWTRAHIVDARERLYRSLREQYTVTIAPVQDAALTRGRP